MDKYNLDPRDIVKLRAGIDQGLGTRMGGKRGNVLTDIVGDLRKEGILKTSGPGHQSFYNKEQVKYLNLA